MERTCLSAFTSPKSPYPPYISINLIGGTVEISVRSDCLDGQTCGDVAVISMGTEEFRRLGVEALQRLGEVHPSPLLGS